MKVLEPLLNTQKKNIFALNFERDYASSSHFYYIVMSFLLFNICIPPQFSLFIFYLIIGPIYTRD